MKISDGKRVRLKVKLSVKDGDVIEQSVVEYFQGAGTMLPGLETVLDGLEAGAKKTGTIAAKNAFGSAKHQPIKLIPRKEFPKEPEPEIGSQFQAKSDQGQDVILKIEKVDDESVTVRLVHPLADKDIDYDFEVIAVSDPKPPPLPAEAIAKDDADDSDEAKA